METNESGNQYRDELFEELKDKCKSIVKRDFYGWLICCILVIPLFFTEIRLDNTMDIKFLKKWKVNVCVGGWLSLFSFRLLKKFDTLDTPDRLLYWFGKKHRHNWIVWLVSCIVIIGTYFVSFGFSIGACLGGTIIIVIFAIIYKNGGPLWHLKEESIIEQLQELADKK